MDKAKEMLCFTDMKASQISYEVGYKDPHYFSYLFKKRKDVLQVNIDQGGCNEKYVRESIARFRQFSIEKTKMVKDGRDNSCVSGDYHALVIMINFNESYNEAVKTYQ